ncbi:MAG: PD-(D/E)XK nuclease family protein [Bryobacteraceae bacterium]
MDDRLLEAIRGGAAVVTAGNRLARQLRQDYDGIQRSGGLLAWPAPTVVPWAGWLDSLWQEAFYSQADPLILLDEWQERVLWERVIGESADAAQLLQKRAAAAEARQAWELATAWRLDFDRIEQSGGEDARTFARWARTFRQRCSSRHWLDEASLPDYLRERVHALRLPGRLILAGFDDITPQQQDLWDACKLAGCAVERLDYALRSREGAVRVAFADARGEIAAAARWSRTLLQSGAAGRIAIAVPDLETRRDQVERIFRAILEPGSELPGSRPLSLLVNLSAGRPLAAYPVVHAALLILGLDLERTPWDEASELLRSGYVAAADTEQSARAQVDARMRRIRDPQVGLRHLAELAAANGCPALARSIRQWIASIENAPLSQLPGGWSNTFAELLSSFGWPGERPLNSIEYQTVEAWRDALSELAAADVTSAAVSRADAVELLRSVAAEEMFQPETVDAPVQVLGLLETAGLTFDHVWVMGLHDEAWPEPPKPNPFLPVALQRQIGIPRCSPEREIDFAQRVTRRLMASAPDVVLSYPAHVEDRDLAPSPLILGARRIEAEQLDLGEEATYVDIIRRNRLIEQFVDEVAPAVEDAGSQRGGSKVFEYQSQCPFHAFAELRLLAYNLETPAPGLEMRDRGTLAHYALEDIWRELRTHERLCSHPNLAGLIRESVARAVGRWEEERGSPLPERFARLERQRLERLTAEWLNYEKGREPFEVLPPEEERYVEVSGLRARVKIDRIDRLQDGREVIIDYKTGHKSVRDWETGRPNQPQVPLYAITHDKPLAGVLFGQIRPGDAHFRGLVDETVVIPDTKRVDLAAQVGDWREILNALGEQFLSGRAEGDPNDPAKDCRYCPLNVLCRCGERQKIEVEEA